MGLNDLLRSLATKLGHREQPPVLTTTTEQNAEIADILSLTRDISATTLATSETLKGMVTSLLEAEQRKQEAADRRRLSRTKAASRVKDS